MKNFLLDKVNEVMILLEKAHRIIDSALKNFLSPFILILTLTYVARASPIRERATFASFIYLFDRH